MFTSRRARANCVVIALVFAVGGLLAAGIGLGHDTQAAVGYFLAVGALVFACVDLGIGYMRASATARDGVTAASEGPSGLAFLSLSAAVAGTLILDRLTRPVRSRSPHSCADCCMSSSSSALSSSQR